MKILFVINPISGVGRQKTVEKIIPDTLDLSKFTYEIAYTSYPHHGTRIAADAVINGFDVVVSVGGDGSANDVAQGLVNTKAAMGIIPLGSGNGLARHLKIPTNIGKAIAIINGYKISKIDTATLNDKLFISLAGIGFDALVAEKFQSVKKRGFFTYFKIVISEFRRYKCPKYNISFDGQLIARNALLISFANSGQFGYNANIAPSASLTDGFIDLCVVSKLSTFRAATIAHKLFLKSIDRSKYVEVFKAKEISISCESSSPSHIDGDFNECIMEAKVKIFPLSLNVIIP